MLRYDFETGKFNTKTRFMNNEDFDQVIDIDHSSSGEYAWEPEDLYNEWKSDGGVGLVAIDSDDSFILGFCIYNLDNEFYEIKHFVVHKSFQRLGVGSTMINKMKSKLNDRRYILSYNIPEENLGFQLFLKKMGFKAKLIRHSLGDFYRFEYEKG